MSVVPGYSVWIAPGVAPGTGEPTFDQKVDISSYVKEVHVRAGASLDLNRIESATCEVVLNNTDARFTPLNTAGPYYPNLIPFIPFGIDWISDSSATPFTLGVSHLGQVDCTLYASAPASSKIFRGMVQAWNPAWWTAGGGELTLVCVDQFRYYQLATLKAASFSQQTAGQRISAILTAIGSTFPSSIDQGGITMKATSYTGSALDAIRATALLDGGVAYVRSDGILVFNSLATLLLSSTWQTSQATFGDAGGEINYLGSERAGLHVSYDEQLLANQIDGQTQAGVSIATVSSATSKTNYLTRPYDFGVTDAVTQAQLLNRANFELASRKDPRLRVDAVAFEIDDPSTDSSALTALDINQRVTVTRRPDKGSAITHDYIIQGFEHDITVIPFRWEMRAILASAPAAFWVLGVSALDTGTVLL